MIATRRKIYTDKILDNLLDAQKNMASAEKVDAKGLVYLSRFILRLLKQLDDEVIELCAEAEESTTAPWHERREPHGQQQKAQRAAGTGTLGKDGKRNQAFETADIMVDSRFALAKHHDLPKCSENQPDQ